MTTTPLSPAMPAGPRPVVWTCPDFHRLGDLGAFEGRWAMLSFRHLERIDKFASRV